MHTRARFGLLAGLSAVLLLPSASSADTIGITGGYLDFNGSYNLVGEARGFRLFGNVFDSMWPHLVAFCPGDTCDPGDVASVRHANGGLDFEGPQATLDGVFYDVVNSFSGTAWAGIGFESSVQLPPISTSAVLRTPFTMTGLFSVDDGFTQEPLVGSGIATMTWRAGSTDEEGQRQWFLEALRYDFFAANPVPEPTTIVLAGVAGAAAMLGRRRRRPR